MVDLGSSPPQTKSIQQMVFTAPLCDTMKLSGPVVI